MPMFNIKEYRDSYSKTSKNLWQCYKNKPFLTTASAIENFTAANNSKLFEYK